MKVLVTTGNTNIPIDQVRSISNIFHGRTGTSIAKYFYDMGHNVTLDTSNMPIADKVFGEAADYINLEGANIRLVRYKTFDDLENLMAQQIMNNDYDIIIHSAAISDYKVSGTMIEQDGKLVEIDSSTKISSEHNALYLKLVQTPKLIGKIRNEWGYKKFICMFKLQVGITPEELWQVAIKRMHDFNANMIVSNLLETSDKDAWIIPAETDTPEYVARPVLPAVLYDRIMERVL